jgi:hypothetical protein
MNPNDAFPAPISNNPCICPNMKNLEKSHASGTYLQLGDGGHQDVISSQDWRQHAMPLSII